MKILTILSGGLDSTVALYHAIDRASVSGVEAISFTYGQRHFIEIEAAYRICKEILIPHKIINLDYGDHAPSKVMVGGALTDGRVPVPHGHYEDKSMARTVVPNRNMIFIALAVARAVQIGATEVWYGAHAGDHAIYPDCRTNFICALGEAVRLGTEDAVQLVAPFSGWKKDEIVRRGANLRVPFEKTWSCYEGGEVHCGRCGTCVERREAFVRGFVMDPTIYAP